MGLHGRLGEVVHGLTYLALASVLYAERDVLRRAGRVARATSVVVTGSLIFLAFGFLVAVPVHEAFGGPAELFAGVAAGVGFSGMLLGSSVLGPALLRRPRARTSSRILSAMLPVLGATIVLALVAPGFAHPAHLETAVHFGLALIGVDALRDRAHRSEAAVRQPV